MRTVPTIDDIFALAHQIGVPLPQWLRRSHDWSSALHELAHWAVKPTGYVHCYVEQVKPFGDVLLLNSIPDAESVMRWETRPTVRWPDGSERQLSHDHIHVYELDPTPNEYGARAWGQQVLDFMGWRHPMDCPELRTPLRDEFGYAQFDVNCLKGDPHPISCYGPDQLSFMGIDVACGILRPQVSVDFDGRWIQVRREGRIIWQWDVFQGLEVVAWESLSPDAKAYQPISVQALLAIAEAHSH